MNTSILIISIHPIRLIKNVLAKFQHESSSRLVVEFIGLVNIKFITLIVTLAKKSVLGKLKR